MLVYVCNIEASACLHCNEETDQLDYCETYSINTTKPVHLNHYVCLVIRMVTTSVMFG